MLFQYVSCFYICIDMSHLKIVRVSAKRLCLSNYSCNSMEYSYNQDLTLTKCSICKMHFSDKIMQQNAIETYCRNPKKYFHCNFFKRFLYFKSIPNWENTNREENTITMWWLHLMLMGSWAVSHDKAASALL